MRIFDVTKTRELSEAECDKEKGYFSEEEIIVGHRPSLIETIQNPDGSVTTTKHNSLEITERILIYKPFTTKDVYEKEIRDLERWFETEYREMFEKCIRRVQLNKLMSDNSDPNEILLGIYEKAERNALKIRTLKEKIRSIIQL